MKCPHCKRPDVHPSKSQDQGSGWLLNLVACRFRCRRCMHVFHITKLRAALTYSARKPIKSPA
jgi:transposase-like protein